MRLRQRTKVDLPQPDGPMMASTLRGCDRERDVLDRARGSPNQALRSCDLELGSLDGFEPGDGSVHACTRRRVASLATQAERADEQQQAERGAPGLVVPVLVRADGVVEDLHRQRRGRLQSGRQFQYWLLSAVKSSGAVSPAARAIDEQRGGDDAAERRAQHHREAGAPRRHAERQRRLAQRARHQADHLLGGARQRRDHEDGQRHRAGQRREAVHRQRR